MQRTLNNMWIFVICWMQFPTKMVLTSISRRLTFFFLNQKNEEEERISYSFRLPCSYRFHLSPTTPQHTCSLLYKATYKVSSCVLLRRYFLQILHTLNVWFAAFIRNFQYLISIAWYIYALLTNITNFFFVCQSNSMSINSHVCV